MENRMESLNKALRALIKKEEGMRKKLLLISMSLAFGLLAFVWGTEKGQAAPVLNPAIDLSKPNYAYSPPLRKFMDSLPGVCGLTAPNGLGQCIPLATAQTYSGFPNDDYYEIALVEYREQLHRDLPPVVGTWPGPQTGGTLLRGYVQEINGVPVGTPHYLGPLILATKNRPIRIKFTNRLPVGAAGDLFLPVDTTIMGAGMGPMDAYGNPCDNTAPGATCASYTQNRATIHLHGGLPPWISDGTAHQWITPAGEFPYVRGASQQNVPDMDVPAEGSATFYWTNQQSGRLMFYHDHALGITGPNVYAGEAAGYLLVDPVEETALANMGVPGTTADLAHLIPLVIQDKTFVSNATTTVTDPTWQTAKWGAEGSLWFPHVYQPNQDPTDPSGANPLGRWDYGAWFWPVFPSEIPPTVSHVPEAFMDTPLVNGTAYPYIEVAAAPYRLKILNACNDRMLNLQLYQADAGYTVASTGTASVLNGVVTGITVANAGSGYPPNSSPMVHISGGGGGGAWATATVNGAGIVTAINVVSGGFGYTSPPTVIVGGNTEVKMIPALQDAAIPFPAAWTAQTPGMIPDILDGRVSGVPDPTLRGPGMVQIATEGGLLPGPVVLANTPVGFEQNKRNIVVLNVLEKTLYLAPAERADVIIDFSQFAGKTLILYNDSPAPVPAGDPRYDFYTGNPDYSETGGANNQGGAPSTLPGYGPNTRTIMQIRVAGTDSGVPGPVDDVPAALVSSLTSSLPALFAATQDAPIVPESAYNGLLYSGGSTTDTYARIQDMSLTFTPYGSATPTTLYVQNKTIQELFDPQGRMNATLGVELPFTNAGNQTTVPLGFIDPVTETLAPGEIQIWKITHNGVDTHGIHFHLVNVQVINRVGWDGAIRPPDDNELGWKDTVRMNPLEDIIVAMQAKMPIVPFAVPDSIRLLNPAMPQGSTFPSFSPLTGQPITVTNDIFNFGWEYTWHCHILGHEENDMMRPVVVRVNPISTGIPGAPTAVTAVPGDASAIVSFASPTSGSGTLSIISYTVTASPGGITASGPASPIKISGLTNGTAYTFTVTATNNAPATGPASLPSNSVTPNVVPAAPIMGFATAGNAQATVYFAPPASNGGTPILDYTVTSSSGNFTATGAGSPLTVVGLTNATAYSFTVTARNALGSSLASAPSNTVVPGSVPGAPTAVTAVPGNGQATVSFTAPASNGGSPIVIYTVTASGGGGQIGTGATSPIMVTGLTNGTSYTFTVTAWNVNGSGPASAPSPSILVATVPGAPTAVTAVAGNGTATVNFTAPASNGGSAITLYTVTSTPGNITATGAASPISVPGLTNNTDYTFTVTATNVMGTGPASSASNSVTPTATVPARPTGLAATNSVLSTSPPTVSLTWVDNSNNEVGFTIQRATNNTFTTNLTTFTVGVNVTTYTDTTVSPKTRYYYRVQAFDNIGNSTFSVAVTLLTVGQLPLDPTNLAVTGVTQTTVSLSWTDNATNETSYYVYRSLAGATGPWTRLAVQPANTQTFTDTGRLRNRNYWYEVRANDSASGLSNPSNVVQATTLP
jgi:FtsP/CotA-like multicopper oxidase with cupredoxin domain